LFFFGELDSTHGKPPEAYSSLLLFLQRLCPGRGEVLQPKSMRVITETTKGCFLALGKKGLIFPGFEKTGGFLLALGMARKLLSIYSITKEDQTYGRRGEMAFLSPAILTTLTRGGPAL
jgi:hypothetical protein